MTRESWRDKLPRERKVGRSRSAIHKRVQALAAFVAAWVLGGCGDPISCPSGFIRQGGSCKPEVGAQDRDAAVSVPVTDAGQEPVCEGPACDGGTALDPCLVGNGGCGPHAICTMDPEVSCECEPDHVLSGSSCVPLVDQVVSGERHACAVTSSGLLYCWGSNAAGQLGGASLTASHEGAPQPVLPERRFQSVAAGAAHTCAVSAGALLCWGDNTYGQTGLGLGQTSVAEPTALEGDDWTKVSAGRSHTCGLRGARGAQHLYCWGKEFTSTMVFSPHEPWPGTFWREVSVGDQMACAILNSGTLHCWGVSNDGALGLGEITSALTPTQVGSAADWTSIAVGQLSSCGTRGQGELHCWGYPSLMPESRRTNVLVPERFAPDQTWQSVAVSSSGEHACAVSTDGSLWCWGANDAGQAGQPIAPLDSESPLSVVSAGGWSAVSVGKVHSCGIQSGRAACWGSNREGVLGVGTDLPYLIERPTRVGNEDGWSSVSAAGAATCGIQSGQLLCWGVRSDLNELSALPSLVGDAAGWTDVSVNAFGQGLGLRDGSAMRFGGREGEGLVPDTAMGDWDSISMTRGYGLSDWSAVARCALRENALYCWGNNGDGQLGLGNTTSVELPTRVTGSWQSISQGPRHTCGVSTDGKLFCWGRKEQVGLGASSNVLVPTRVGNGDGWTSVAAGASETCGLKGGDLFCWDTSSPRQITPGGEWTSTSVWQAIYGGLRNGAIYQWGYQPDGSFAPQPALFDDGAGGEWSSLSVGELQSCAIKLDGSLWCWGLNSRGQTGLGPSWSINPIFVEFTAD